MNRRRGRAEHKRIALVALLALVTAIIPFQIMARAPAPGSNDTANASPIPSVETPAAPASAAPSAGATPETSAEPQDASTGPSPPAVEPTAVAAQSPTPSPAATAAGEAPSPTSTPGAALDDGLPYLITFISDEAFAARADLLVGQALAETSAISALRMATVNVPFDHAIERVAALRSSALVARVEADRQRSVEAGPDDPLYGEQWALARIGWPTVRNDPPAGVALVAVLDTGVDASHPELAGRLVGGASFVEGAAADVDPHGHGTWMAGLVAALTDNGQGIAGAGNDALRVMPVTVIGPDGNGRDSDIISGLVHAVDHGADVILMAFASQGYSAALQAAVDYAWEHDVVVVAAAGNDGSASPAYPAGDAGVVGVAATQSDDTLWPSSNSGPAVFIAAPGAEVLTTEPGGYRSISGTSAAAAFVAAAAGLLRAADASLTNGAIVGRLARSAEALGTREQTGNGSLDLARAWADSGRAEVRPRGVLDGAGPYVGPYTGSYTVAAAGFRAASQNGVGSGVTSLVISKPSGTTTGDVLVASISIRPNTATISPPSGWTLIRRTDQANSAQSSQAAYYKIATASEGSSYTWTLGSSPTGAAGGILAFSNISSCSPVDVSAGQANNTSSTGQAAPSVTTTQAGDVLITGHSFASSATWTPPSGMTEAVDVASETVPNVAGVAVEVNYLLLGAAGATGTKTATASNDADVGVGQTIALRSSCTKTWDGGAGTNNWADANNWNPDGVPSASDDVSLTGAGTINVNTAAAANDLTLNNASLTLTINSGQSLTVTGNLTLTAGTLNTQASFPSVTGTTSLAAGSTVGYTAASGSQTVAVRSYGNLTISGGGTKTLAGTITPASNLTLSGGTFDLSSFSANRASAGGTLTLANGATLKIGGTGTLPTNYSTHSIGSTSTIEYAGTTTSVAALNSSQSYGNLVISGSGVTTSATFTVGTALTVNGGSSLVASSGTLTMASGSSISNSGTLTFRGLTVPASATVSTASSFSIAAALTTGSGATFAPSGGTITLTGTGWSLALTSTPTFAGLTVAGTPTTQPSASFSVAAALTVGGGVTLAPTGGTITLNNGASIVNSGTLTFQGLTLAASAAVSATGSFAVAGTFTVNASATFSPVAASVISGAGTLTGSGTVLVTRTAATADFSSQYTITNKTLTNLTVEYTGAAAQTISALAYAKLKINNASGATLAATVTVSSTLTLAVGNITTGASTLVMASGATVSRTSGHVVGNLQKAVSTGSPSVTYEIGDSSAYTPVTVAFASVSVGGTVAASTAAGDHAQIGSSTINAVKTANRTWTLTGGGVTFTSYTVTLNFSGADVDAGADPTAFKVGLYSAAAWSYPTLGTVTSISTQASAISAFGDFQVGEDGMSNAYRSAGSGTWATASTWQRWNGSAWVAAASAPSSSSGVITILNGHTVTIGATVTIDETTVDAGGVLVVNAALTIADGSGTDLSASGTVRQDASGSLTINSGASIDFGAASSYLHNRNGGTIPTASWDPTSTIEVSGWTSQTTSPGGIAQAFGNFTWNSSGQTADISLAGSMSNENGASVAGTLSIVSTGSGSLRLLNSGATRALTVGSFSQSGGIFAVRGAGSAGATNMTLTVSGAFSQTGGTFRVSESTGSGTNSGLLEVMGDFSMAGGTLTRTGSTGSATVNFVGSSAQTYTKSSGTMSGTVDFGISPGATVNFGTSALDGSSGSFTLNLGAAMGIGDPSGISISGSSGNIQVSGTRTFSTGASYVYNGTPGQATGSGLPATVGGLTINNSAGVSLTSGVSVSGTLYLTGGVLSTGANSVYVSSTGSLSRASGWVNGNLKGYVATGAASRTFDIGDASNYLPVTVNFASVSVAGDLTVSTTTGDHPAAISSSINRDRNASRYWTLTNSGITFTNYAVTFTFAGGDLDAGADTSAFIVDRYASGSWTTPTTGTRTSTTTLATGVTATGDFAVGEARSLGIFSAAEDIGSPTLAGYAAEANGTYTVSASGVDIWGTADQFQYLYRTLTGDGRITARVVSITNTDAWAKAGLMIRESTAAGSAHGMAAMTPSNGMAFQYRSTTNGTSSNANQTGLTVPYWVRVTRAGDTFTAERSANGVSWAQQGSSATISVAASVTIGLAVTAHTNSATTTAVFDNVSISTQPTAADDTYGTTPGTQLGVAAPGVLGNDSDPEDEPLSASLVTNVTNGSLSLSGDGSFTYTPNGGFAGLDSFTYRAFDGGLYSASATVTIGVYASVGFQAEDYVAGSATGAGFSTVNEGSALGGEAITTNGNNTAAAGPPAERVQYDVYFPNAGATNTYHLYVRYRMLTDSANDDSGWALGPLDSSPAAGGNWDQINDLNVHGDTTYRWVDLAATAGINGVAAYTNVSGGLHSWWFGGREDGLYVDAFVFSTGFNLDTTSEGQAILDAAVNDRPSAVADAYEFDEDDTLNVSADGVLANDTDPENDALTAVLVSDVGNGSLTLNSDGSFDYTPSSNFNGSDSFTYRAADNMVSSASAATVVITVNAVNDVPSFTKGSNQTVVEEAGAQSVTAWATAISAGPADESGQAVNFIVGNDNTGLFSDQPAVSATGTLTYTPAPDANGSATVSVQIHDNGGTANGGADTSAVQTFTIAIDGVNDPPVNSVPGAQATAVNMAITFSNIGGNAISIADIDAGTSEVQVQLTAADGTLTLASTSGLTFSVGDGTADATMTFTGTMTAINAALDGLTFTPTTQFVGTANVQIVTSDQGATGSGGALNDTDSVSIDVINAAPTSADDSYAVFQDNGLVVAAPGVLANDTDPNPQTLSVQTPRPVSGPSNGSLTLNADGSFTYTPTGGFTGSDSFTYKLTDGIADSELATVTITVNSTAYVSSSAWSSSFSSSRYLDLSFPAYVASGATVEGATLRHSYRSYAGGTTCYYFEVYSGASLIGTHGNTGSPVSCNAGSTFVSDAVSLPEINSASRANTISVRLYVRNSADGRSEHNRATVGVIYWLGNP